MVFKSPVFVACSSSRSMATASGGWLAEDERKMLHAVYRVGDLEKTEEYYTKHLGMKRLRYRDQPDVSVRSPVHPIKFLSLSPQQHVRPAAGQVHQPVPGFWPGGPGQLQPGADVHTNQEQNPVSFVYG